MRLIVLRCEGPSFTDFSASPVTPEVHDIPAVPTRRDLRMIDDAALDVLPEDPTPSLDEIAQQPDVAHLGAPHTAPQQPEYPLRVVVIGSDAALSAVITRLMRADNMWVEVGFVPTGDSVAAKNWGLPEDPAQALRLALTGVVKPVPTVRDDAAVAVAGSASITDWGSDETSGEITGEIIVDDHVLIRHESTEKTPRRGVFGARLVPMMDAPGIVAAIMDTPIPGTELKKGLRKRPTGTLIPESLATGRAIQAGGPTLRVIVDGVSRKRAVERVTFYRHLRDLQVVRP